MSKKFTDDDYAKLYELGYKFLPLSMCGSKFQMTANEFSDSYQLDKKAQLSYESGRTDGYEKTLDILHSSAADGDFKSTQYLLAEVASTKDEVKKSGTVSVVEKKTVKKKDGLSHLTNPKLLKDKLK